jgi:hypothetical protein
MAIRPPRLRYDMQWVKGQGLRAHGHAPLRLRRESCPFRRRIPSKEPTPSIFEVQYAFLKFLKRRAYTPILASSSLGYAAQMAQRARSPRKRILICKHILIPFNHHEGNRTAEALPGADRTACSRQPCDQLRHSLNRLARDVAPVRRRTGSQSPPNAHQLRLRFHYGYYWF